MSIEKIVIVEDDHRFLALIDAVAQTMGIKNIVGARDGAEAIRVVEEGGADLMILDLMMAGVDGIECTSRIRSGQTRVNRDIPIVMLTACTDDDSERRAREAGVSVFLTKPVTIKKLFGGISAALGGFRFEAAR